MKRKLLLFLILSLSLLVGCTWLDPPSAETLTVVATPDAGYPPLDVRIRALGVGPGQFSYEVEGKTYERAESFLDVRVLDLPCVVTVTWLGTGDPQEAKTTIILRNQGPIIGNPVLNSIPNLWTIHPRVKYLVTFPNVTDFEGGPVTLVHASVWNEAQGKENTVFCPPFTGMNPPEVDFYRVRTLQGDIENAFLFFSLWDGPLCGTLPYTPPSQGLSSYPPASLICGPFWTTKTYPNVHDTIITATFEDECGARTTESWFIPTMPYYPVCQTPSGVCL